MLFFIIYFIKKINNYNNLIRVLLRVFEILERYLRFCYLTDTNLVLVHHLNTS
jgi:hypothetical protein